MMNSEGDAIKNGRDQTGSGVFTVNYNPSHGFLGDLLESGVDKAGGTTGIAKQTGDFIYDVTMARGVSGSNFANHSQGNLLVQRGIEYRVENGGLPPMEYFYNPSGKNEKERLLGVPTFSSFGSPVNTGDMRNTVEKLINYRYSGAYTHPDDAVGELLGGNVGQDGQLSAAERVGSTINLWELFRGSKKSPHSTYLCVEHGTAKCGEQP